MPTIIGPDRNDLQRLGFEAYGVTVAIGVRNPELLPRIRELLPPDWRDCDPADAEDHFALVTHDAGEYRIWWDDGTASGSGTVSGSVDVEVALHVLDSRLRRHVALKAPNHIFVHAGAVAYGGRAVLIPGMSFSGKSTLVAELVRAGATYYSDEYAVLDQDGLVHPYAKPLSMRAGGRDQTNHHVSAFGGIAGEEPAEVGLVVVTQYRPGAQWQPRRVSAGAGVMALIGNTVPARDRPEEALPVVRKAAEGAIFLEGDRGEAAAVARAADRRRSGLIPFRSPAGGGFREAPLLRRPRPLSRSA